ncbi:hypothetical protein [Opitutus terrae]|uniref:TPR repeat-containing protein n=1 Tax=Opitutus terrae (strain DSM 11246 / JCM 15787 / PB90-1) TaxID=452637 RepID=B1ZPP5_OPITP|nr:TPR repeat-containing protein [Opitutus terrae PB90-1]
MEAGTPGEAKLKAMIARFVPVEIKVDVSHLPPNELAALHKMVEAATLFDTLFLRQSAPQNEALLAQLVRDASPLSRARLHYFRINAGAWSRLDERAPFLPGVREKPAVVRTALGYHLVALDRVDEAMPPLEDALKLDPYCTPAHYRLAQALETLERPEIAQRYLREAARLEAEQLNR